MTGQQLRNEIAKSYFQKFLKITGLVWYGFKAIKRTGGLKIFLSRLIFIFNQEGVKGIIYRLRSSDRNNYVKWLKSYDRYPVEGKTILSGKQKEFSSMPLISVIMPVFDPETEWLTEAIESVRLQIYHNWELCIADDASTNPEIRKILNRYQELDRRIKVVFRETNGHISACSNSALKIATGDWIALLDHDDLLTAHALLRVAETIDHCPHAKLIYSDEDKIDQRGIRRDPYFKCDWNPELFRVQNMICHLGVYKAEIVHATGGFRIGFEGSQDYDLALRVIERIDRKDIVHIPEILYHWRMHSKSVSLNINSKEYANLAAMKAINEHFDRTGTKAEVQFLKSGLLRIRYSMPTGNPLVSIIIPTKNNYTLLKKCIDSILSKTIYNQYELIIVNNNSDETDAISYLRELEAGNRVHVEALNIPFNFSKLVNYGVSLAKGEFVCLLNNDIEVIAPEWLGEMLSIAAQPGVGAVGAKLLYPDRTIQHGGVILGVGGVAGHAHKHLPASATGYFGRAALTQEMSAVTGACMVVNRSIFLSTGGFDEVNLTVSFNDVDFCLRLREASYRNIWTPHALLYHHESVSRGTDDTGEKAQRFNKEIDYMMTIWAKAIPNDPAYNPNLTLVYEDFSLAWPPRNRPV